MDKAQIGLNIKNLRESLDMSQEDLADELGLKTQSSVSKWERGINIPRGKVRTKLLKLFGCTWDDLVDGLELHKNEDQLFESLAKTTNELMSYKNKEIEQLKVLLDECQEKAEYCHALEEIFGEGILKTILENDSLIMILKGILSDIPQSTDQVLDADLPDPKKINRSSNQ